MNNEWIPVSSGELPPKGANVQVTYLGYFDSEPHCDGFAYRYDKAWSWSLDDSECEVEITAWKPCGEPYRGKENV